MKHKQGIVSKLTEFSSVCKIMNYNRVDWGPVLEPLQRMPTKELGVTGTNLLLCAEDGQNIAFHEFLVKKFTRIFEMIKMPTADIDTLRDSNGNLVFVISGVSIRVLKALSELLYSGTATLESKKSIDDLLSLLSTDIVSGCSSKDTENLDNDMDMIHLQQQQLKRKRQDGAKSPNNISKKIDLDEFFIINSDEENESDEIEKLEAPKIASGHEDDVTYNLIDSGSDTNSVHLHPSNAHEQGSTGTGAMSDTADREGMDLDIDFTAEDFEVYQEQPEKTQVINESGELRTSSNEKETSTAANSSTVDGSIFEVGKTFSSYDDFITKWDAYYKNSYNNYQKYSRHKNPDKDPTGRFPYKDSTFRCVHYGYARPSDSKGQRIAQKHNACGCKAEIRVMFVEKRQCYVVRLFEAEHSNHESTKASFETYARNRKLSQSQEQKYGELIAWTSHKNRKELLKKIQKETGKPLTEQDLRNIFARYKSEHDTNN